MNTCFNFRHGCNKSAITEFCPECLMNGGIYSRSINKVAFIKRLYNSIRVMTEPNKTNEQYSNLHSNGYIFKWVVKLRAKR